MYYVYHTYTCDFENLIFGTYASNLNETNVKFLDSYRIVYIGLCNDLILTVRMRCRRFVISTAINGVIRVLSYLLRYRVTSCFFEKKLHFQTNSWMISEKMNNLLLTGTCYSCRCRIEGIKSGNKANVIFLEHL